MTRHPLFSWLPLSVALVLAVASLIGLMLGAAWDRKDMTPLGVNSEFTAEVMIDRGAALTFASALAAPEAAWSEVKNTEFLRSVHGEVVWVRVTLKNPGLHAMRGVLTDSELFTDQIDLWTPVENGVWRYERAGEWAPAKHKAIPGREAAFFIEVPGRGERVVYLRVEDHFGVWMRPVWWMDQRAFLSSQMRGTLLESGYFGVLLALFVYNSVLWARLRHRDLGYYLGYLGMLGLFMVMYRTQHLVLGLALGSPFAEPLAGFALAMSGFFVVQFARDFLQLGTLLPRADRWARGVGVFALVQAIAAFTLGWSHHTGLLHFIVGAYALTHTLLFGAAIFAWRAGSYHARFFVFHSVCCLS